VAIISRSELLRFIFNPFGVGPSTALPQVPPGAIHIQPLSGLPQVSPVALISRSELLRFIFNPFGVGGPPRPFPRFHQLLLSRGANYYVSYSTPSGLGPSTALPQVSPVALISRSELLRFIFNPFGVGALHDPSPGLSRVASYCVSPLALISRSELLRFIFNPFGVISLRSLLRLARRWHIFH
jgi:hypothetical protein